jgi:nicotinamidase-related amidase
MVHDPYWDLELEPVFPDFDPAKTALLIIDMQNMCSHPKGWMGRLCDDQGMPGHLDERFAMMEEIAPNLQRLMGFCRKTGVEIFHVRIAFRTKTGRDGKRALINRMETTPLIPFDLEIWEPVKPLPDEIVLDKTSVSTFNSTAIDQILRNMGRDRIWTAGCVTEGCVELTTRDAADRGYWTTLVTDCCASSRHSAHDDAVQRITDGNIIRGYTADQLIAMAGH